MKSLLSFWQKGEIGGVGDAVLLEQPLTAFFASSGEYMEDTMQRLTAERAMRRNYWVAALATQIVVAEAAPDGGLASCLAQWKSEGHQVNYLLAV